MEAMIFNPLSVISKLNYVKLTNGDLLIIMLKCKRYICKILSCIDRFESYLKIPWQIMTGIILADYDIL